MLLLRFSLLFLPGRRRFYLVINLISFTYVNIAEVVSGKQGSRTGVMCAVVVSVDSSGWRLNMARGGGSPWGV